MAADEHRDCDPDVSGSRGTGILCLANCNSPGTATERKTSAIPRCRRATAWSAVPRHVRVDIKLKGEDVEAVLAALRDSKLWCRRSLRVLGDRRGAAGTIVSAGAHLCIANVYTYR